MSCPHLQETSALFDGATEDRAHADGCVECGAFLADAARLRESLRGLTFDAPPPRRRVARVLVPAAIVLSLLVFLLLRPRSVEESGPFAGLDGGGRATIAVKESP